MSHLVCPLCGKNAPLSTLNPSVLDLDIKVVRFQGLGRGKGFKVSEEWSILGDDQVTPLIAKRIVELCGMLVNNNIINREVLAAGLGIRYSEPTIVKNLENQLHDSQALIRKMKTELDAVNRGYNIESARANRLFEFIRNSVRKIDEEFSIEGEWEHGSNDPLRALPERTQLMIQIHNETHKELEEAEAKLENTNDVIAEVVSDIEDATDYALEENEKTYEELLREAVDLIIEELESLKAGIEE
jgi:hypothetical protein